VKVLKEAPVDKIILTEIYEVAGREDEKIKKLVTSQKLVKTINKDSVIFVEKRKIKKFLEKNLMGGEVVIFMGAGDIYKTASELVIQ
jgi:UDP-N-acetylmuramate-alanine ligase